MVLNNFTRQNAHVKTLIEANVAVKTTDGYLLRLFCIGFTKRSPNQTKKTSYAQKSIVRQIRAKMVEIIQKEVLHYLIIWIYLFDYSVK